MCIHAPGPQNTPSPKRPRKRTPGDRFWTFFGLSCGGGYREADYTHEMHGYIHMKFHMYIHMKIHMYIHMKFMCTWKSICIYVYTHGNPYVYTHEAHRHVHMKINMYIQMIIHMYIHMKSICIYTPGPKNTTPPKTP